MVRGPHLRQASHRHLQPTLPSRPPPPPIVSEASPPQTPTWLQPRCPPAGEPHPLRRPAGVATPIPSPPQRRPGPAGSSLLRRGVVGGGGRSGLAPGLGRRRRQL